MKNKTKILLMLSMVVIMTVVLTISLNATDTDVFDVSVNQDGSVMAYVDGLMGTCWHMRIVGEGEFIDLSSALIRDKYYGLADSYAMAESYLKFIVSVEVGDGITKISGGAFTGCGLAHNEFTVSLPNTLTEIGALAFAGCSTLKSITIPSSVTEIGEMAFMLCTSLESVSIPSSVTTIKASAFKNCTSLNKIIIPSTVVSVGEVDSIYEGIGNSVFEGCDNITVYCEADSQPSTWNANWNASGYTVEWGYFDEEGCLEDIFAFKGYSFNENGGFAVGFGIDYDMLALYEEKTGQTLEIGVVFAGYDNLNGKQPLDANGKAITLDNGLVIKADLTDFTYPSYDFMLVDITEDLRDIKLVISVYIYNGNEVKYVQENGISDTVSGISYNEAKEKVGQ